jgi:hypothetical protein
MLTVAGLRRLVTGLPDDQEVMLIDKDGMAVRIEDIDPVTVQDTGTGKNVLTLEFVEGEEFFGFGQNAFGWTIDTTEDADEDYG